MLAARSVGLIANWPQNSLRVCWVNICVVYRQTRLSECENHQVSKGALNCRIVHLAETYKRPRTRMQSYSLNASARR